MSALALPEPPSSRKGLGKGLLWRHQAIASAERPGWDLPWSSREVPGQALLWMHQAIALAKRLG